LGAHQLDNEDSYEELDDENKKERRKICKEQNDEY
jgi:hypothetical protein